ncbi:MAG: transglutaminase domain-containing protein [Dehalococcoidia bacterium]|nr:transglutaminase domain-containing protein [Dehalococcoidia bacterium]
MNRLGVLLGLIIVLVAGLATADYASATPSEGFRELNGDVFDDWEICRTRAFGEDGFYQISETTLRPVIAFESLGENAALAYSLGERIADKYPDRFQGAEAVFRFVRDRVNYTPDIDQFDHDEFALNADELATSIDQNGVGYGDCEDSAVLLAVMYKGAGFRSAIVVGSGHTAALVYLPDYNKAATFFELEGEPGWVWAEATGKKNALGWTSTEFINVKLAAYEISEETIAPSKPTAAPAVAVAGTGGGSSSQPFPFISIIGLLWLMSMFRRRRRAR